MKLLLVDAKGVFQIVDAVAWVSVDTDEMASEHTANKEQQLAMRKLVNAFEKETKGEHALTEDVRELLTVDDDVQTVLEAMKDAMRVKAERDESRSVVHLVEIATSFGITHLATNVCADYASLLKVKK